MLAKKNNNLFTEVRQLIIAARETVYRNVNTLQVFTNFLIGKAIVEHEQLGNMRAAYGRKQLTTISRRLTKEFGRGYSADNLELMRKFYSTYQDRIGINLLPISETLSRKSQKKSSTAIVLKSPVQISETVSRISSADKHLLQLSWSHFVLLMKMDEVERRFYEIESVANNWSIRELERQYNSSLYERLALSKDKNKVKQLSKKGQQLQHPLDLIKQPYILEFLGLKEESAYTESELETAIINRIEHFMMELGKGFLFDSRQKRITLSGDDYFIDLVFYNRLLRCFILIDLKIGKLVHKDLGQMQMYVNYYDRKIKSKDENNTIGIVLCKQSNRAVVEFTLPEKQKQIFAREYKLYLPGKEQLKKQIENL
ncbi:MAG: PDDEXK nuclease domain-containing protein [Bacteroidia bacterium]